MKLNVRFVNSVFHGMLGDRNCHALDVEFPIIGGSIRRVTRLESVQV